MVLKKLLTFAFVLGALTAMFQPSKASLSTQTAQSNYILVLTDYRDEKAMPPFQKMLRMGYFLNSDSAYTARIVKVNNNAPTSLFNVPIMNLNGTFKFPIQPRTTILIPEDRIIGAQGKGSVGKTIGVKELKFLPMDVGLTAVDTHINFVSAP